MEQLKLILDSGATKTAWILIQGNNILQQGKTIGLNPYLNTLEVLLEHIQNIQYVIAKPIDEVYFYGAGCRSLDKKALMYSLWEQSAPTAKIIEIEDDITATAHALCQYQIGVVCVLGTGASSGLYNGSQIIQYAPSNGIWLGDEGSGAYLGKMLIKAYLDEELPDSLRINFEQKYPQETRDSILRNVYEKRSPSTYLGQFTPFLKEHQYHSFIARLLSDAFDSLFTKYIQYKNSWKEYPVYIGGSTAHHFKAQLYGIAASRQISIANISQGIIEGLTSFHQKNNTF